MFSNPLHNSSLRLRKAAIQQGQLNPRALMGGDALSQIPAQPAGITAPMPLRPQNGDGLAAAGLMRVGMQPLSSAAPLGSMIDLANRKRLGML